LLGCFLGSFIRCNFLAFLDKLVSDSLDNLSFIIFLNLNSLSKSGILFNGRIELNSSSSIFKENLVDSFRISVLSLGDRLDSISVVLEALVMIGVIFRLGHGL
jgi:hypothetical protein